MIALAAKHPLAGGFTRRGACPALSAPMQTGDGLLVRLNPVAGGLSPAQLAGLCDAAGMFGNGVIGQFMTFARPERGFWLAVLGVVLLAAASLVRGRISQRRAVS